MRLRVDKLRHWQPQHGRHGDIEQRQGKRRGKRKLEPLPVHLGALAGAAFLHVGFYLRAKGLIARFFYALAYGRQPGFPRPVGSGGLFGGQVDKRAFHDRAPCGWPFRTRCALAAAGHTAHRDYGSAGIRLFLCLIAQFLHGGLDGVHVRGGCIILHK